MSKTKKIILLVSMVVVLAVAAYLNIMLLSKKSGENGGGDGSVHKHVFQYLPRGQRYRPQGGNSQSRRNNQC